MTSEQKPPITNATIFGLLGYIVLTCVIGEYLLNLKLKKRICFFQVFYSLGASIIQHILPSIIVVVAYTMVSNTLTYFLRRICFKNASLFEQLKVLVVFCKML